jgi:hypothetical protein
MNKSTETVVRQLQQKRLTKEQIADQLLKEGGYDADDIGAALERVFGREHRTKSQLPSYKP